jgi:hypothetical protein
MRRLDVRVDDGLADGLDDQHRLAEATAPPRPVAPAVTWVSVAEAVRRTRMSARWVTEQARTGRLHGRRPGMDGYSTRSTSTTMPRLALRCGSRRHPHIPFSDELEARAAHQNPARASLRRITRPDLGRSALTSILERRSPHPRCRGATAAQPRVSRAADDCGACTPCPRGQLGVVRRGDPGQPSLRTHFVLQ